MLFLSVFISECSRPNIYTVRSTLVFFFSAFAIFKVKEGGGVHFPLTLIAMWSIGMSWMPSIFFIYDDHSASVFMAYFLSKFLYLTISLGFVNFASIKCLSISSLKYLSSSISSQVASNMLIPFLEPLSLRFLLFRLYFMVFCAIS